MTRCRAVNRDGSRCSKRAVVGGFCMGHYMMENGVKHRKRVKDAGHIFLSGKGVAGILIFVLFIVLVVAVLMLFIFLHGKDEPYRPPVNVSVNKTYFNITIGSNALYPVSYIVSNASGLMLKGTLYPSLIEEFSKPIEANTTVLLEAFGDRYYYNKTVCNVTRNKQLCRVLLKEKAVDYDLILSKDSVEFKVHRGVIQAPVMICWIEKANVQNVLMNLSLIVQVPAELRAKVDFCYIYPYDIRKDLVLPIVVRKNEFNNVQDVLSILVQDYEVKPYIPIGFREAGVIV